jgi:hypothetical protein
MFIVAIFSSSICIYKADILYFGPDFFGLCPRECFRLIVIRVFGHGTPIIFPLGNYILFEKEKVKCLHPRHTVHKEDL